MHNSYPFIILNCWPVVTDLCIEKKLNFPETFFARVAMGIRSMFVLIIFDSIYRKRDSLIIYQSLMFKGRDEILLYQQEMNNIVK